VGAWEHILSLGIEKTICLQEGVFLLTHHQVGTLDELRYDVCLDSGMKRFDLIQASLLQEVSSMPEPRQKLATTSIS